MNDYPYNSPRRIQAALAARNAGIRKRWGQSFLVDPGSIQKIARACLAGQEDPLLEIGPGFGALTRELLMAGRTVFCVELDPALADILTTELEPRERFRLCVDDARTVLGELAAGRSVQFNSSAGAQSLAPAAARLVVGNLPYYITTELLTECVALGGVARGVFLTQLEFAARVVAEKSESSLGVFLANFGNWKRLFDLGPANFFPRPQVSSTLMEFRAHPAGPLAPPLILEKLLRMSFAARRKKLQNSWKHQPLLDPALVADLAGVVGVNPEARAEEIPPAAYHELARRLAGAGATA